MDFAELDSWHVTIHQDPAGPGDRLEHTDSTAPAAERLRFVLDFGYATDLRAQELVTATVGDITTHARGCVMPRGDRQGVEVRARGTATTCAPAGIRPHRRWQPSRRSIVQEAVPALASAARLRQIRVEFFREAAERVNARHTPSTSHIASTENFLRYVLVNLYASRVFGYRGDFVIFAT